MIVDKHILSEILDDKLEKFVAPLFAKIAGLEAELEKRSIDHLHDLDEAKEGLNVMNLLFIDGEKRGF